jgi:deoxycytidine triphosphate deaminase
MKKLLVLVGMQGAGKTTVLNRFRGGSVLKPSTMRKPRFAEENEYHFETVWNTPDFAWTIIRGQTNYGMRWSELRAVDQVGLTVFDPTTLNTLRASPAAEEFEIVTIGLDTISTVSEQHSRVAHDANRLVQQAEFDTQLDAIKNCDVVLRGDENTVINAVEAVASILGGRGGVLSAESIKPLILAGTLLSDSDTANIESASYDLRIYDTYWCQGKYHTLTAENPVLTIPPYSFALVQAREQARLPRFIAATFDIRVSLFFSGVILSNGPQVDPGYSGALFCMLHNASGSDVGINRDDHFSSIQFQTLATTSTGYNAQYQNKKGFKDFLAGSDSKKPGGQIYEHVNAIGENLKKEFKELRTNVMMVTLAVLAIFAGLFGAIGSWLVDKAITAAADKTTSTMEAAATDASAKLASTQKQIDEALAKLKQNRPK